MFVTRTCFRGVKAYMQGRSRILLALRRLRPFKQLTCSQCSICLQLCTEIPCNLSISPSLDGRGSYCMIIFRYFPITGYDWYTNAVGRTLDINV